MNCQSYEDSLSQNQRTLNQIKFQTLKLLQWEKTIYSLHNHTPFIKYLYKMQSIKQNNVLQANFTINLVLFILVCCLQDKSLL